MTEKIQKILANAGVGSRREIEKWIIDQRIMVNGRLAQLGDRIYGTEKISIDGKPLKYQTRSTDRTRILIYHKPEGEVASNKDPEGRPTVFDRLPPLTRQRWIQVGRLDLNTSGLLLFTTNGELANYLMHPRNEFEREYAVRIRGQVTQENLDNLEKGVMLEDGLARFNSIIADSRGTGVNHWYHVVLKEGRNREVRRLWETQGLTVSRLIRVRYASIQLPRFLRIGSYEEMSHSAVKQFLIDISYS